MDIGNGGTKDGTGKPNDDLYTTSNRFPKHSHNRAAGNDFCRFPGGSAPAAGSISSRCSSTAAGGSSGYSSGGRGSTAAGDTSDCFGRFHGDSAEAVSQEEAVRKKAYEETYEEIYREILENLHAFTPSDQVACRITEEHITSYLENNHEERILQYRERRDKRFLKTVELVAALAAVSFIVYSLKDNSAILVTLLYIIAALGGLYLWKSLKKPEGGTFLSKDNEEDRS